MTPLFQKLNLKNQSPVLILNAPATFADEMAALAAFVPVLTDWPAPAQKISFLLAFATQQAEVDAFAASFADNTTGDVIAWVAYPKGSSKRYKCDFNRDTGWTLLGTFGFEPVRQVAIDGDWSALRFRRVDFIQTMTRSFAMSETGKAKVVERPAPERIPDDFSAFLEKAPAARVFLENLSPSHKKEYLRWIEEAKRPETRLRRMEKAVEMLAAGQKFR